MVLDKHRPLLCRTEVLFPKLIIRYFVAAWKEEEVSPMLFPLGRWKHSLLFGNRWNRTENPQTVRPISSPLQPYRVVCQALHCLWGYKRLLCPWDSPGKNTGVGCHFLPQGTFPTQGSKLRLLPLLHWQADSLPLSHLGGPYCIIYAPVIYKTTSMASTAVTLVCRQINRILFMLPASNSPEEKW